jgi:hypothetical protein
LLHCQRGVDEDGFFLAGIRVDASRISSHICMPN